MKYLIFTFVTLNLLFFSCGDPLHSEAEKIVRCLRANGGEWEVHQVKEYYLSEPEIELLFSESSTGILQFTKEKVGDGYRVGSWLPANEPEEETSYNIIYEYHDSFPFASVYYFKGDGSRSHKRFSISSDWNREQMKWGTTSYSGDTIMYYSLTLDKL